MQFLEDLFIEPLRYLKAFLLGRGLLTMGVIAAWGISSALGAGVVLPAVVMGVGGALLTGFMRLTNQRLYEDQMVNLYRDGIAQLVGVAPEQVTRAHLREAAQTNDVIDQAMNRQSRINWISFGTAALAAAVTVGLLISPLPAMLVAAVGSETTLGTVLSYTGFGLISAMSSLVVHDGLQTVIGVKTGVRKAAAHDRIVEMERGLARGWGVSKEQVYGALVAGNPALQDSIQREFGKAYADMRPSDQAHVLNEIGVADEMLAIASEINAGRLRPANLAFMMNEAMPRRPAHAVNDNEITPARSHVAALGRAPRNEAMGHVARLDANRAMAALSERGMS